MIRSPDDTDELNPPQAGDRAGVPVWLLWFVPAATAAAFALPRMFGERWYGDAPFYQGISLRAARDGAWWPLMQGDLPFLNKPPLQFWLHGASSFLLGETDWSGKLPEAVIFALMCVATALLAARLHGRRVGLLAGMAMALTSEWHWRVPNFRLDFLHTLLMVLAMRCLVDAAARPGRRGAAWAIGAGGWLGLALLTKPLFALAVPVIAIVWLALLRRLDRAALGRIALCVPAAIVVAAPWHVSMLRTFGMHFFDVYVRQQSLARAMGEMFDPEPWYWYLRYLVTPTGRWLAIDPIWFWPVLALALAGVVVTATRKSRSMWRAGDVLALLWTFGWLTALSCFSDKRNNYLLVIHPGTAWLAAIALYRFLPATREFWKWLGRLLPIAAATGIALGVYAASDARTRLPVPADRAALYELIRSFPAGQVYNGGLKYPDAAAVYISTGVWPRSLVEKEFVPRESIPPGAIAVYDRQPGQNKRPLPDDRDEMLLDTGRFAVVRRAADAALPAIHTP